ncbi:MAG: hypothetical protein ACRENB_10310 [Gemmatimonadales bacterium]
MCPKQPLWMTVAMLLTTVLLVTTTLAFRRVELEPAFRIALVVVTLAPMIAWVLGFMRWLRDIDELERLIQLQAMGVALGSTALVVIGLGLMVEGGLVALDTRSRAWFYLWAWMVAAWSLGQIAIRRRYQ